MKRRMMAGLAVAVLLCVCSGSASAQAKRCKGYWTCSVYNLWGDTACYPIPPLGAIFIGDCGPWCAVLEVKNAGAYCGNPDNCPRCAANATSPISLATGNTFIDQTDVSLPGLAGGLTLTRTWNSRPSPVGSSSLGMFGPNWRSTYEERVFVGTDGYVKYGRSDGALWSFAYLEGTGDGTYSKYSAVSPAGGGGGASLVVTPSSWSIPFGNGEQRVFDTKTGNLLAIIDRNGNKIQISYDGSHRMSSVTDAAGRHLYFNYPAGGTLVTSVTSDVGLTLTYSYDNQGRLIQVTKPDQSTVNFEYDSNSMITAVKDSQGKILESHTYDSSGRGLTGSRAGGVDAVTITYPQ